jgi:hypothetical protein
MAHSGLRAEFLSEQAHGLRGQSNFTDTSIAISIRASGIEVTFQFVANTPTGVDT